MNYTYRIASLQDRDNYIDFINYVFSFSHRPHDFKALYPREYRDGFEGKAVHFLALNETGQIRAVVAVLPFRMQIASYRLSCGFIGSVSVHPYARGEGHMKKLMAMANQWMIEHNVDLAILDGKRQRYQYYGYSKGGAMFYYNINKDNIRHGLKNIDTTPYRIIPVTDSADDVLERIHDIHSRTQVHVDRDFSQIYYILTGGNRRLYAVWKGEHFDGYLSASEDDSLCELVLSDISDYAPVIKLWGHTCQADRFQIFAMSWDRALTDTLDTFAEAAHIQPGGNIKVFNWEHALPAMLSLKQIAAGPLSDGHCCLSPHGKKMGLCVENGNITIAAENPASPAKPALNSCTDNSCNEDIPSGLSLQEKIFSTGAFLHPQTVNREPTDWFPIPFALPLPDHF